MKTSFFGCALLIGALACSAQNETGTSGAAGGHGAAGGAETTVPLLFTLDPGLRVDHATNAWARVAEQEDGSQKVYLWFFDREQSATGPADPKVIVSSDGSNFDRADAIEYQAPYQGVPDDFLLNDPRHKLLPAEENGGPVWRRFNATPDGLKTSTSTDGINFSEDDGYVYGYHNEGEGYENDQDKIGYNDVYPTSDGRLVFAYIADMQAGGYNNVRLATSSDNGKSFLWHSANALDDAKLVDEGGHQACAYVDPKSTVLPDGHIWLFVMTQDCEPPAPTAGRASGYIHSFQSSDGVSFVHDEGLRLQPSDFDWETFGFVVYSLNDPTVVRLVDGRYRMFVTARICESQEPADCDGGGPGNIREALVSATATP